MEQAHENKMTRDETLKVALMVGKILLKSGAETYRVEDTINRFCIANGYEVDIFVTPTVIILGNEQVDSFNCVSRIRYRTTNLGMISEMNDMSYKFERWPMSYRGTMAWLEEKLKAQVPYGKWKVCLVPGVAFTNGLRDYMAGDLLSGNARIAEALLFAASIAIGIAFALRAWVLWGWDLWK